MVLIVLSLAGCGGDSGGDSTQPPGSASADEGFVVGAVDDAVRAPGPKLDQLHDAGFDAVGVTSFWQPGLSAPTPEELDVLRDVAGRADGTRIFLSVYHPGSATTPLTAEARSQFASYVGAIVREVPEIRDIVVGNEPNLNRFWLPQFDESGNDVAAPAYFALLSEAYDAAKKADEDVTIWGGALAPRGIDRPGTGRDTHSPTTFIRDLGAAYQASGRTEPPLDGFAFHPYPASSSIPPDRPTDSASKSILLADYEEKLAPLLGKRSATGLPVLYSELGVETAIPAGEGIALRGHGTGKAGRRGDAGRLLPTRDQAGFLPEGRRRAAALPLTRRTGADRLPVRRLLRRRDAEDEPRARAQGDPRPPAVVRTMCP